ncbi:hypothetical protein HOY82DRAFT_319749 [Tuber indicum]|nr:hypothetical protein HOY82DRAFT_319749 [Tuber indicum]
MIRTHKAELNAFVELSWLHWLVVERRYLYRVQILRYHTTLPNPLAMSRPVHNAADYQVCFSKPTYTLSSPPPSSRVFSTNHSTNCHTMSEESEALSDPEENPERMSFMDTLKAYTEDLEAPIPPHQEYSPAPSHTTSSFSAIHSNSGSDSMNTSDEQEESEYLEDSEGEGDDSFEDLSSTLSTPPTPSSTSDFRNPSPVPDTSSRSTPKAGSNPHLPTPSTSTRKNKDKISSPSLFISLLSSSSSDSSSLSSSEDEVTIIRSRALPPQPLKRKLLDSLEPRKKIHRMERERDREWSVRDRGVLAEAMQDGMDFNRVARMLGREVDEVFRMFTKVIAGILLHAPRPRDKSTQTEWSFEDGAGFAAGLGHGDGRALD